MALNRLLLAFVFDDETHETKSLRWTPRRAVYKKVYLSQNFKNQLD